MRRDEAGFNEMRRAAKKDRNHELIVTALRKVGVRVRTLNEKDLPDLLTGFEGTLRLLEVKDGERKPSERRLRSGQQAFFAEFNGCPVYKVENVFEALSVHGIEVQ